MDLVRRARAGDPEAFVALMERHKVDLIQGNNIRNTDYELGTGSRPEMELMLCFNRLVDPAQVSAVGVDGTVYPVLTE